MTIKDTEKKVHITIKAIDVEDIYGLTASVLFDEHLTNLTGTLGGGRTRIFECFKAMRTSAYMGDCYLSDRIFRTVHDGSRMSFTLQYGEDRTVTYIMSFHADGEEMIGMWEWRVSAVDGMITFNSRDISEGREMPDDMRDIIDRCVDWLTHRVVTDIHEAMEHLSGLPYKILGTLGVRDASDLDSHLGQMIPWLCCFGDDNITIWLDDIFDSIHTLVVRRFGELLGSRARHHCGQYIMSSRCVDALVDSYPCWFFMYGKSVKISGYQDSMEDKRGDDYHYRLWTKDSPGYTWKAMLDKSYDRVVDDIQAMDRGEMDERN